jgi:hypothetical protein
MAANGLKFSHLAHEIGGRRPPAMIKAFTTTTVEVSVMPGYDRRMSLLGIVVYIEQARLLKC